LPLCPSPAYSMNDKTACSLGPEFWKGQQESGERRHA